MTLTIVIVNWNTRQDLLGCLRSIDASPPSVVYQVLVVDNASSDGSAEAVRAEFSDVVVMASQENLGFARANNRAAAQAQGQYLLLLNPDTVVDRGAVDKLLQYMQEHPEVAVVGPRLLNPDGSLQPSVQRLPTLFREWWRLFHLDRILAVSEYPASLLAAQQPLRVEGLNGACLLVRRTALAGKDVFDEEYFVYSEEIDLCDRLHRAGWELHWVPAATVMHAGGQSTRQAADRMFIELYRNKIKFFRKRRGRLAGFLYKLVLAQASVARYVLGQAGRLVPGGRQRGWLEVARQYRLLLAALPQL